jgi:glyoxylate/hydroxypyruvate reductase A
MTAPIRVVLARDDASASETWRAALQAAFDRAGLAAEITLFDGRPRGADYAVVWRPPADLTRVETGLRALFNLGAGVERVLDLEASGALPRALPLYRLVDAGMAPRMAEYVCFFIARITRRLDSFAPMRAVDWHFERPRGAAPAVGVLGLGAIGARVAQAAAVLGYPVNGWVRTPRGASDADNTNGARIFAGPAALDDFLAATGILVNALPLTPATRDLIDARRLARLPRGAHFINIGRGQSVVDADLLAALDSGQLAGAVLDVFHEEPLPADHPFNRHPAVTVTPHLSGPTPREPAARQVAAGIAALHAGAAPETVAGFVDRARGY